MTTPDSPAIKDLERCSQDPVSSMCFQVALLENELLARRMEEAGAWKPDPDGISIERIKELVRELDTFAHEVVYAPITKEDGQMLSLAVDALRRLKTELEVM